jgi:hypothetical protein
MHLTGNYELNYIKILLILNNCFLEVENFDPSYLKLVISLDVYSIVGNSIIQIKLPK